MKLALLIFLSSINQTLGYPSAAGSCTTVGGSHSKPGKGALSGLAQVSLAGTVLNPSTPHIIEHCPSSFESKATLNLSGIGENTFRGFVINVSSDSGTDISDALIADGSEEGSPQEFPLNFGISCPPGVSGVCHTSREDKSLVSVLLDSDIIGDLPSEKDGETWSLNVIAVVANNFADGRDLWYESKYTLEIHNKCGVEITEPELEVVDPKPEPVDVDTEVVDTEPIEPEPVDVDTEVVDTESKEPEAVDVDTEVVDTESNEPEPVDIDTEVVETESIDSEPIDVDNEVVDTESIDSEPIEPTDPDSEPESNANIISSTLITSVLVTFSVLLTL